MKAILLLLLTALATPVCAQSATLRGLVSDESGAPVAGAKVTLKGEVTKTTTTGADGVFSFLALAPGDYTLQVAANDLVLGDPVKVNVKATGLQSQNLVLRIAPVKQELNVVESAAPLVSTESANNASAVVIKGSDLDALADDPEDLIADLQALAGPAAGPNGGSIFIDGFSGGQLPAKESIREIRINQNPFSAEYDKLGLGRIEIFTKPGTDKFRGMVSYNWASQALNSRNPYAAMKAPFRINELQGNLGGPLSKRGSFFLDVQREAVDNGSIINGAIIDPTTLAVIDPYTNTFRTLQRRYAISPRVDYQLNANNTLVVRYRFNDDDIAGAGIGSFNLVSRGNHVDNRNQTAQATETMVIGSSIINESRFQYFRPRVETTANDPSAAVLVLSSFNGGGSQAGRTLDVQNNYELQNYTSIVHGPHVWKFGVRYRAQTDDNLSPQNFGGTFVFGGGLGPELNAANQLVVDPSTGQPVQVQVTSLERYRRTLLFEQQGLSSAQIRTLGGGATQFTIAAGDPRLSAAQQDVGIFVGDDWRVRRNITMNVGLRYETQTNIHDRRDFAPRIGMAWAPNGKSTKPKTVVRAGFGVFYDRFALGNTLAADRYNNVVVQQYVVSNPDFFPSIPAIASLPSTNSARTTQEISASLRAPYVMQTAISLERQLPANTTIAFTYAGSRGLHLLRSDDINAPLPGTYNANIAGSGVFPMGHAGPVLLMESAGLYNQNQFIVNLNTKVNKNVSLFSSYVLNHAESNTDSLATYPANPYSSAGEYSPAANDVRNRVTLGGSLIAKWNIRFNPLLTIDSGPPFNLTTGNDYYGTTLYNSRPGIATNPAKVGVVSTAYGLLDPNPTPDELIVPRNYGRGPGSMQVNLRIGKLFGFGGNREGTAPSVGGGGDRNRGASPFSTAAPQQSAGPVTHPYNLNLSLSIRNLLNHNNPGPIDGNITSALFGRANQPAGGGGGGGGFSEAANNRRLEFQARFTF